jgi:hypothetical protein
MTTEAALWRLPTEWDDGNVSLPDVWTMCGMTMVAEADRLGRDLNLCDLYIYSFIYFVLFRLVFGFLHVLSFSHSFRM